MAAATRVALGSCRDRPSSAPACRRARWWRTAPSVTPRSRAMWLLVAPRAAKVLMVMRASGSSRLILASAPRNGAVRGPQPETTARKSGCRLTRNLNCPPSRPLTAGLDHEIETRKQSVGHLKALGGIGLESLHGLCGQALRHERSPC